MADLKSLTFTTLPTPGADPTLDRRARTIARLEEQKLLLNCINGDDEDPIGVWHPHPFPKQIALDWQEHQP
jgi:hypothetical protein